MPNAKRGHADYALYSAMIFFFFFAYGAFISMLSIYTTGLGKTAAETSLIVSSSYIFGLAMQPVIGMLGDRMNTSTLGIITMVSSGLLGVAFALSKQTWLLFLLGGLALSLVNSLNPICERLATATRYSYGSVRVWGTVGYAIANQLAGTLYQYFSPQSVYYAFAISAMLTALFFFLFRFQPDAEKVAQRPKPKAKVPISSVIKNPAYLFFLVLSVIFAASFTLNNSFMPLYLVEVGFDVSQTGTILFIGTFVELPMLLLSGKFMDRLSGKSLLVIDFFMCSLQFGVFGFVRNKAVVAVAAGALRSLTSMLFVMITLKIIISIVPETSVSTAMGMAATVKALGTILFQNLGGTLVDMASLQILFRVMMAVTVGGLLLSLFFRAGSHGGTIFGSGKQQPDTPNPETAGT